MASILYQFSAWTTYVWKIKSKNYWLHMEHYMKGKTGESY